MRREQSRAEWWCFKTLQPFGVWSGRAKSSFPRPRIFDRFARAGNVVGHIQGTGIGLTIVRGIVEQHGGTVSGESQEGQGSTFTIRLPLAT